MRHLNTRPHQVLAITGLMVLATAATLAVVGAGLWLANLVKLADTCCTPDAVLVLRTLGVALVPIGIVMGLL